MSKAFLEHVNITVSDPDRAAATLASVFGWRVRWSGASMGGGRTVHVGGEQSYVALYSVDPNAPAAGDSYHTLQGLNHLAIVVDDLHETERLVIAAGFKPHSHASYEPGRRFYFDDLDGIEYEVVSY